MPESPPLDGKPFIAGHSSFAGRVLFVRFGNLFNNKNIYLLPNQNYQQLFTFWTQKLKTGTYRKKKKI